MQCTVQFKADETAWRFEKVLRNPLKPGKQIDRHWRTCQDRKAFLFTETARHYRNFFKTSCPFNAPLPETTM